MLPRGCANSFVCVCAACWLFPLTVTDNEESCKCQRAVLSPGRCLVLLSDAVTLNEQ